MTTVEACAICDLGRHIVLLDQATEIHNIYNWVILMSAVGGAQWL